MKTKETAEKLLSYIESNRRNGNTTLLIEGAKRYDKPFYILGWSIEHANEKIKLNSLENFGKPLSIFQMDNARGSGMPLAIDTDIMCWLIGKLMLEFDQQEIKHIADKKHLKNKVETQRMTLRNRTILLFKIAKMTWWERIFTAPGLLDNYSY